MDAILRRKSVMKMIDASDSTLDRRVKRGEFPSPISLGGRSVGWLKSEVEAWLESKKAARDQLASQRVAK